MLKHILSNALIAILLLTSCSGGFKAGDARKIPANMKERQRQNIEEEEVSALVKHLEIKRASLILLAQMNFGELR